MTSEPALVRTLEQILLDEPPDEPRAVASGSFEMAALEDKGGMIAGEEARAQQLGPGSISGLRLTSWQAGQGAALILYK